ncbi:MAG: hypothetical protein E6J90_05290 [Deltaproteobacteria bacterium]|nr:MAG: hypothetical protein E6J91_35410 [Deltaproteobacteria bacterium]TMQ25825.1 MAG: hypothetical protein E6J90_05290 [Deltaproteobacteria bacterium]
MITSLELLDAAECARLEGAIKELRARWVMRGTSPTSGFFTLGAASYLDGADDYAARAGELNPVLRDTFAGLYARVAEFLSARLRAPVGFADGLALPGFHIWLAPAIFVTPVASVHFDLQYLRAWPEATPGLDLRRPLSFTLPIRLPRRGGGLNVWDVTYERYRRFVARVPGAIQPVDVTVLLERMRHPYTPGAIALHSGHLLHQIGEIDEVAPDDERITLQGHALLQRGEWKLYW